MHVRAVDVIGHNKPVTGSKSHDIIDAKSTQGFGQLHIFSYDGNDHIKLRFDQITGFSHGHHARGGSRDNRGDSANTFEFTDISNVKGTIVGRLEDFDYSRDTIMIDGRSLDLTNLPSHVRLVRYNGEHNDPDNEPQLWIHIRTPAGGDIFYALEGARIDLDPSAPGGSQAGSHEAHFLGTEPDIEAWATVPFADPLNFVPDGLNLGGGNGVIINDVDITREDVKKIISGTQDRDLIAGGINGDTIKSGGGNDWVSGGSGYDSILGGDGNDMLLGASGNDTVRGEAGNDAVIGGYGKDFLYGGSGDDFVSGWGDNDWLWAGSGDDLLNGGPGNDALIAGSGSDTMIGGAGEDVFIFNAACDDLVIEDFEDNIDTLRLLNLSEDSLRDVNKIARIQDVNGDGNADLVLEFEQGGTIVLLDLTLAQLQNDLIFT